MRGAAIPIGRVVDQHHAEHVRIALELENAAQAVGLLLVKAPDGQEGRVGTALEQEMIASSSSAAQRGGRIRRAFPPACTRPRPAEPIPARPKHRHRDCPGRRATFSELPSALSTARRDRFRGASARLTRSPEPREIAIWPACGRSGSIAFHC